ncbi:MAG TPA: HlyD family efflux transporter periplasmic adaptor subunit [Gemmataceae bacterium]|jgi:HlyD family secretion protein|nr:HlyD family efflux transporter periplasmic adaptor subunit [Gemmataceae bacterium]
MMARVNRTTGFFLILGVAVLIVSVTGVNIIMRDTGSGGGAPADDKATSVVPDVVCTGKVDVPAGLLLLGPGVPGRVVDLYVREGEEVTANQKILKVNDTEAQAKLAEARYKLNEAKSAREDLKLASNERKAALDELSRKVQMAYNSWGYASQFRQQTQELKMQKLAKDTDLTLAQAKEDEARSQYESVKKALEDFKANDPIPTKTQQAERAVKVAEDTLRAAEKIVEEHILLAPKDGSIAQLNVQVGEAIGPNSPTPPVRFRPKGDLIVRAEVDQAHIDRVKVGMPVALTNSGGPGSLQWKGTVERISDIIGPRRQRILEPGQYNDVRTCECIIRVDSDSDHPLRLGQVMVVRIHPGK